MEAAFLSDAASEAPVRSHMVNTCSERHPYPAASHVEDRETTFIIDNPICITWKNGAFGI